MKFDKTKILKKATYPVVTVVLIAGAAWGYLAAKNASLKATAYTPSSEEIARLENKIAHLEHDFKTHVQNDAPITVADISALNEKFNNLNKINAEILDSKASLSAVMGLIERIDSIESEVKKLNAGTSNSALVLTAAALVENAAKRRQPFMYEASVLEELSRGTPMEKSAQIIAGLSIKGIPSREELIDRFIKLYEVTFIEQNEPMPMQAPENQDKDWKQNLKDKFESLLVVEKISEGGELEMTRTEAPVDDIYRLVRDGEFEAAALKMSANKNYQTEAFEIWIEDTRAEKTFNKQMAKIKALTLGEMKAETLR